MENNGIQPFRVRCYHKSELAAMYMPQVERDSAVRTLMRWIDRNTALYERLIKTGYRRSNRMFSAAQVREIIVVLGEP